MFTLIAQHPIEVRRALFSLGYRNLFVHEIGQIIVSLLVFGASWNVVPEDDLLTWMAWQGVTSLAMAVGLLFFRKASLEPELGAQTLIRWRLAHLVMITMIGIGWGIESSMMVPDKPVHNLMILNAFGGTLAYSSVSNAPHDPIAFGTSAVVAIAVLLWQIPRIFGVDTYFVIGMCLLYFFVLVLAAVNSRRTLLELIYLKISNEKLALTNATNAAVAVQANQEKSEFLAAASHDLRQPVHALLLLIEAFKKQEPKASSHPLMRHISSAGQSISSLFSALMDLSRLESGRDRLRVSNIDMAALLTKMREQFRHEACEKKIHIAVFLPKNAHEIVIETDKLVLEQILSNLISNAIRYTSIGGVLLALRRNVGTNSLSLEIWDSGLGILESDQSRIFQPYVQVGNKQRDRTQGLGLGLAIVHQAIANLGWKISVKSKFGKGSCFKVEIPNHILKTGVASIVTPALPTSPIDSSACIKVLNRRKILLVEDDPIVVAAMESIFVSWNVDFRCASIGDESVLNAMEPDWVPECILCDFRLPGKMNGVVLLDFLLERFPTAVGVLQTGEPESVVREKADDAGYVVLFKPIAPDLLASFLGSALERRATPRIK
jgi:two-component system, sensor histidine kinase